MNAKVILLGCTSCMFIYFLHSIILGFVLVLLCVLATSSGMYPKLDWMISLKNANVASKFDDTMSPFYSGCKCTPIFLKDSARIFQLYSLAEGVFSSLRASNSGKGASLRLTLAACNFAKARSTLPNITPFSIP